MKQIRQTPFEEIVQAFLRTEWDYREVPVRDESKRNVVFSRDFDNQKENLERQNMLLSFRAPIVDEIPEDTVWFEVECDEESFFSLRVIKESDWIAFSGGTGEMEVASIFVYEKMKCDQTFLKVVDAEGKVMSTHDLQGHISRVEGILPEIGKESFDTYLIALRDNVSMTSTLLDGNHRAVAIFIRNFITKDIDSFFPFRMYEGVTSSKCRWCW